MNKQTHSPNPSGTGTENTANIADAVNHNGNQEALIHSQGQATGALNSTISLVGDPEASLRVAGPIEDLERKVRETLRNYWYRGICALPADPKSSGITLPMPDGSTLSDWERYKHELPARDLLDYWYDGKHTLRLTGLAAICGSVSRGLVAIQFHTRNDPSPKGIFADVHKILPEDLLDKLVVEVTPNGHHLFFRCDQRLKKQNLAAVFSDGGNPTLRIVGEGEYALCAPSMGYKPFHRNLANVSWLSEAEVGTLFGVLRNAAEQADSIWLTSRRAKRRK